MALLAHRMYGGKLQTAPRCGIWGPAWFGVWYTPGVSAVSTAIRDDNAESFELSGRGNTVAVVSDSTRVLGDGDVTPPGGMGVMEGKAFLMKYLGGIDAVPLCVDSCGIPVWHDAAQGTACVTLAGFLISLERAGDANSMIARLLTQDGSDPSRLSLFDKAGGLHPGREDLEQDPDSYRQWALARRTNPDRFAAPADALKGADILVALSTPGPDVVKRFWV